MPYSAFPTTTDLQNFYKAAGLISDATVAPYNSLDWAGAVGKASAAIARETGRVFLVTRATRTYDPPRGQSGILNLRADLCSDSSDPDPIVVTVAGKTQVLNRDYYLGPDNADQDGKPWTWIDFSSQFPGSNLIQRKSITVSGDWGYSLQIPGDVWSATLAYAAYTIAPAVALNISKGLLSWKEGDEEERYAAGRDAGPLSHEMGEWLAQYQTVRDSLKRVESWF